jgi:hypothetical protein
MDERQRRSRRQERRIANRVQGRTQPASGATPWRKQDVRQSDFLIEAKFTDRGSYSIKASEWERMRRNALLDGRRPMLVVELQGRRLVVMEEDDLL